MAASNGLHICLVCLYIIVTYAPVALPESRAALLPACIQCLRPAAQRTPLLCFTHHSTGQSIRVRPFDPVRISPPSHQSVTASFFTVPVSVRQRCTNMHRCCQCKAELAATRRSRLIGSELHQVQSNSSEPLPERGRASSCARGCGCSLWPGFVKSGEA